MEIYSAKYLISNENVDACPKPDKPEYAFIGRSNVGKSSLINMLTNQSRLAKISSSPGKTQLINHFIVNNEWFLVDLPGYGYAKVSQQRRAKWEKMIEDYLRKRPNLVTIFVLIDSRIPPQKLDLEFLGKLGTWGIPFNMIFTKADKITQREVSKNVKTFIEAMKEEWEFIPRSFVTSTIKFLGRKDILKYIAELNNTYKEEIKEDKENKA